MPAAVLFADDDPDVTLAAALALRHLGHPFHSAASPAQALATLAQPPGEPVAVLLLDLNFSRGHTRGEEGLALLAQVRERWPALKVVVITAHAGVDLAVRAMQLGASDFLTKPWANERLATTVANALKLHAAEQGALLARQQAQELGRSPVAGAGAALIGRSPALEHVRAQIQRVAPSDANVLILGENGVGKELVAQAIHRASHRAEAPLVALDMGALSPTLFESELFGHRKGAFTDARQDRVGRIAAANGGTLFLDEIGNLPLPLQPRLLSVLERREVLPLGHNRPLPVDVRVISATNASRDTLADAQHFRADLLFRLNTVEVHVPPLRQRRADIPLLAEHFMQFYTARYGKPPRPFTEAALRAMLNHPWPGNVRALRHAVERSVVMGSGARIEVDDLALGLPDKPALAGTDTSDTAEDLSLEALSRRHIEQVLARRAWNISHAARDLGLTRASLYRRMQRYGL